MNKSIIHKKASNAENKVVCSEFEEEPVKETSESVPGSPPESFFFGYKAYLFEMLLFQRIFLLHCQQSFVKQQNDFYLAFV